MKLTEKGNYMDVITCCKKDIQLLFWCNISMKILIGEQMKMMVGR